MEEHINTSIDIYEQMKEENAMLKEAVERLKREKQNERIEFENKLNSLNEMYSLKERELRTVTSELKKVKDENESYSHIVGPLYIKNSSR